jgi:C-terminal processing protease CtpA/Prc
VILIDESINDTSRKCTLLKKSKNESFGFQVNGKTNIKGNHSVSSVLKKSCADLAGLKVDDKIVSVNSSLVGDATIDQLIKVIENETKKSPMCLELMVNSTNESKKNYELIEINDSDDEQCSKTRKRCNLSKFFKLF